MIRLTTFVGGLINVLISDRVYAPYIRNVSKRLMYHLVQLPSYTPLPYVSTLTVMLMATLYSPQIATAPNNSRPLSRFELILIDLALTSLLANEPVASESGRARHQCLCAAVTLQVNLSFSLLFSVSKHLIKMYC